MQPRRAEARARRADSPYQLITYTTVHIALHQPCYTLLLNILTLFDVLIDLEFWTVEPKYCLRVRPIRDGVIGNVDKH